MGDFLQEFESNWDRFETNLRGKLRLKASQQCFTLGFANIILKESSGSWFSMYDVIGRFLISYSKENPAKGEIINKILKNDLKFTEEIKQKKIPQYFKFAVPLIAGLICGVTARLFSANLSVIIASVAVPAVSLYLCISSLEKNIENRGKEILVKNYVKQLEKFKTSIISVIQN